MDSSGGSCIPGSPRTDAIQADCWEDLTGCLPGNCTLGTVSPHSSNQPPHLRYIPQFDYELHPNLSPLHTMTSPYNYPNPDMTFFNPYMAKSCKRALNTSNSSVGSRPSPLSKRLRQNLSPFFCRTSTGANARHGDDQLCQNCDDSSQAVALCRTCTDYQALCSLCLEAHKRVKLTREHSVHNIKSEKIERSRSIPLVLQSIADLFDDDKKLTHVGLSDHPSASTRDFLRTWSGNLAELSEKEISENRTKCEEIIKDDLIPVFVKSDLETKVKAVEIMEMLFTMSFVSVSPALTTDECVKSFQEMLNSEDSEVVLTALNCLECLVKEVAELGAKFSMIKMHCKLEMSLKRLKEGEVKRHTRAVQFKAGKLIREIEKRLAD